MWTPVQARPRGPLLWWSPVFRVVPGPFQLVHQLEFPLTKQQMHPPLLRLSLNFCRHFTQNNAIATNTPHHTITYKTFDTPFRKK
mmetsp:Transcript_5716/g.12585  ORF Transcript_5716/g.12585 Transcript_5716/m.12585 type:complete len:85 (-) Transcript_5716:67-321(-)